MKNKYRFSTKSYEKVSGCYYYGFRFYDAGVGRWLSRDPIGEDGGRELYGFINNNSIDNYDLFGLVKCDCPSSKKYNKAIGKGRNDDFISNCRNILSLKGCSDPPNNCVCSEESFYGQYDPNSNEIKLNFRTSRSIGSHLKTLRHEYVHAVDHCNGDDWSDCDERACSEVSARVNAGQCRILGILSNRCVKSGAIASAKKGCGGKEAAAKSVDKVYERCKNHKPCKK